jgi:hypothetical protein
MREREHTRPGMLGSGCSTGDERAGDGDDDDGGGDDGLRAPKMASPRSLVGGEWRLH